MNLHSLGQLVVEECSTINVPNQSSQSEVKEHVNLYFVKYVTFIEGIYMSSTLHQVSMGLLQNIEAELIYLKLTIIITVINLLNLLD